MGSSDVGCVITFRPHDDGRFYMLAVSRPDPPLRFALPGGMADPGETPMQAASRELMEETGYAAPVLEPVYVRARGQRVIHVFFAPIVHGKLASSDEGVAAWVEPAVVACGAFPDFSQRMFRVLEIRHAAC
ncbi:MAG: NUDIX domain-containing protein [bacterium]|nr:NUDIX domain-containing protein [bacterium]